MQKAGENKAMPPAENKAAGKGPVEIRYIGHSEERYVTQGPFWPKTIFPRGKPVKVGAALAEALLKQPDKFEVVS